MCRQSSLSGSSLQLASFVRPLIALGALVCFLTLITTSGPHLVHHLADQRPVHPHSHADKSQLPDCLVLALMQHTPVTEHLSVPTVVVLPEVEGPGDELRFAALTTLRPSLRTRSPPALPFS
jgi:hypothetical protein